MGNCVSDDTRCPSDTILDNPNGAQLEFDKRFVMDRVLGEGEFAQVKLVYEKSEPKSSMIAAATYACKIFRKGPHLLPEKLRSEIEMLHSLNGESFCLKMIATYETPQTLLIITDCCTGGEMMEYLSKQKDIRTEDMSRISYQLLSAINHCSENSIIHRDIKPENIMFTTEAPDATLKLIDFGSGTSQVIDGDGMHTTFTGIAFYNSPEMFHKKYSSKTDIWSGGVVLYVMAAGYPYKSLQEAFDILLDSQRQSLKSLPGLPEDMPSEYYEMLEELLLYQHGQRKSAGELLSCAFVKFHQISLRRKNRHQYERNNRLSMLVLGNSSRHSTVLDLAIFERKVTTLLATMLTCDELSKLLSILMARCNNNTSINTRLQVVFFRELKDIINLEIKNMDCLSAIQNIPDEKDYDFLSYHTSLLKNVSQMERDIIDYPTTLNSRSRFQRTASVFIRSQMRSRPKLEKSTQSFSL